MHLGDIDWFALINQMWGSEANLQSYLASEVPKLCAKICGPSASVPAVKVFYPKLKGILGNNEGANVYTEPLRYCPGSDNSLAEILISAMIAGNKPKLPQYLSYALIRHWEALGTVGEMATEYPEAMSTMIARSNLGISEEEVREIYSPGFVAKAAEIARDLEVPLSEFLFPKVSLTVYASAPEQGSTESN